MEASVVAAHLKLQARRLQEFADLCRGNSTLTPELSAQITELKEASAALDGFADKLYLPFLGHEGVANASDHADEAMKIKPNAPKP